MLVWAERRVSALMQDRVGPNRVGPYGLAAGAGRPREVHLQGGRGPRPREQVDVRPRAGDRRGPGHGHVRGDPVRPGHADRRLDIGILFVLSISSLGVYGITLGGWASNSKYALLGGVRSSAQMISYEMTLGISAVGALLTVGSLHLGEIVDVAGLARLVPLPPAARVLHLPDLGLRRDEPPAVRPPRGRDRAGRRVPHRVLVHEVRALLHGRVHEHDRRRRRSSRRCSSAAGRSSASRTSAGRWAC